jgi:hypothetical protein
VREARRESGGLRPPHGAEDVGGGEHAHLLIVAAVLRERRPQKVEGASVRSAQAARERSQRDAGEVRAGLDEDAEHLVRRAKAFVRVVEERMDVAIGHGARQFAPLRFVEIGRLAAPAHHHDRHDGSGRDAVGSDTDISSGEAPRAFCSVGQFYGVLRVATIFEEASSSSRGGGCGELLFAEKIPIPIRPQRMRVAHSHSP